eukprot:TRINITY_DN1887_c0_g2_i1.p1 TRINITY_DN1887_c0_g2~~TRINITY_DN1887_c0_g2_i1.p1  ORF type:complete len:227 (+),score=42.47 TRINITY_DN1887_c0_g2_i1:78-758(+)
MAPAERRSRRVILLGCAAALALLARSSSNGFAFVPFPTSPEQPGELTSRRELLRAGVLGLTSTLLVEPSWGLCEGCKKGVTEPWVKDLNGNDDEIHLGGVEWEDVKVGTGAEPQRGNQIAIDFTIKANVREREVVVDKTTDKPKDFRFGIGQMLPGMDEGIRGMRTGGTRIMRIPGNLAFGPKVVPAAPGRSSIPAFTPVEVEVTLRAVPGADDVYQYGAVDKPSD